MRARERRQQTVGLLSALERGEVFAENVKRLVRASRAMLNAFEEGNLETYTSGRMEDALAPFHGFTDAPDSLTP